MFKSYVSGRQRSRSVRIWCVPATPYYRVSGYEIRGKRYRLGGDVLMCFVPECYINPPINNDNFGNVRTKGTAREL